MFRKLTLISLLFALAAAFVPVLTPAVDAAPASAVNDSFTIDIDSNTGIPLDFDACVALKESIDWAKDFPRTTALGAWLRVGTSLDDLQLQWANGNCKRFNL